MLGGTAPGYESYEERVAEHPTTPIENECEGVDMLYSSGTTGRPKGVKPALSKAPMGEPGPLYQLLSLLFQPDADSVYLSPAPLYHAAPLRYCLTMHRFGATVVVMEKFDPEEALAADREVPRHPQPVGADHVHPDAEAARRRPARRYDVSSLRVAVHAAAPCPVDGQGADDRVVGPDPPRVLRRHRGQRLRLHRLRGLARPHGHRRPLASSARSTSATRRATSCRPGEPGTLYFGNGPAFEYHDDPEKTAASRDPKGRGWTTLGDVGYVDEDGFLYLTDRRAYMIISGGVNIYPQEAENVLAIHPKVADVAVFGVPDAEMGEAVKAVVQPVSMDDAGPELAAELIAYCREHLAHYKCPRSVDFRAELPRHPTGKLYKRLLKDEYWAGHSPKA